MWIGNKIYIHKCRKFSLGITTRFNGGNIYTCIEIGKIRFRFYRRK